MKISKVMAASRKEDLINERNKYDAEMNEYKSRVDEAEDKYDALLYDQQKDLEKKISDLIGPTSLELSIKADPYSSFRSKAWGIRVEANQRNKFSDDVALSWNWDIEVNKEGEIVKDSGSWSGLKAITPAQLSDLEESVRVLKILNNIDWDALLHSPMAKYSDFVTDELTQPYQERKKNRPDFESDIQKAELEEAIGTNTAFELVQDQYYRGSTSILLTGVTNKFLKGYIFPTSWIGDKSKEAIIGNAEERRTSINNLKRTTEGFVTHKV